MKVNRNRSLSHSQKQRDDGRAGSSLQNDATCPLAWAYGAVTSMCAAQCKTTSLRQIQLQAPTGTFHDMTDEIRASPFC